MSAWLRRRPTLRTALTATAVVLIVLCAGGAAEAAMASMDAGDDMHCSTAGAGAHDDCRTANAEMPSLVLAPSAVALAGPPQIRKTPGTLVPAATPDRQTAPSVPRSPPGV